MNPADSGYLSELRSALAHIDDPPYLERHPLAQRLAHLSQNAELSLGQALRRALRLGIAALDPGGDGRPGPLDARSYQVLYHWAICKESTVSIAALLGISRRQTYRELEQAIAALGQVLSGMAPDAGDGSAATPVSGQAGAGLHVREELERLARVTDQDVDLCHLLADVVQSARRLAASHGVEIRMHVAASGLNIAGNRVMLRQAVLNLLSHAISTHHEEALDLYLDRSGPSARLRVLFRAQQGNDVAPQANSPYGLARELCRSLNIDWLEAAEAEGLTTVSLLIPLAQERTVLIVDDNEGIIALFRRYLRGRPYRVYGAGTAEQALRLVGEVQPDIVILDVMMPDRDGWELLQILKAREADRHPLIIVCSIVNDPRLAQALGADAFLSKPVDQASLLEALLAVERHT
ncbi:MAG: ATP-binding response regulator [Anaerolineae bacterium]